MQREMNLVGEMEQAFEKATGKTALGAWDEYEKFVEKNYAPQFAQVFAWRG